jgi:hypothetical protein
MPPFCNARFQLASSLSYLGIRHCSFSGSYIEREFCSPQIKRSTKTHESGPGCKPFGVISWIDCSDRCIQTTSPKEPTTTAYSNCFLNCSNCKRRLSTSPASASTRCSRLTTLSASADLRDCLLTGCSPSTSSDCTSPASRCA